MKNPLWLTAVGASFLLLAGCTINVPPELAARLYGEPEPAAEPETPLPQQVVEVVREVVREVEVPVLSEPVVERVVNNYYVEPEPVEEIVYVHEPRPRTRVSMNIHLGGGHRPPPRPRYRPRPRPPRRCWPPLVVIKPGGGHGGGNERGRGGKGGEGERGGRGGKGGEGERGKPAPEWKGKTKHTTGKPVPRTPSLYADNGG